MKSRGFLAVTFVILLLPRESLSSYGSVLRMLTGTEKETGKPKDSPSPSPVPLVKRDKSVDNLSNSDSNSGKSNKNTTGSVGSDKKVPQSSLEKDNSTKKSNNSTSKGSQNEGHGEKGQSRKKSGAPASTNAPKANENEKCEELTPRCKVQEELTARICHGTGSQNSYLLIKNEGQRLLKINIKVPDSVPIDTKELALAKHTEKKIKVSSDIRNHIGEVTVDCSRPMGSPPVFASGVLQNLPSYANRMTPIYGAYVLFVIVLIVGGIWTCCKFGRRGRRHDAGIPYQELEMGLPQTTVADTADGWDQGWDDDWEEEKITPRTSEIQPVCNVSANGLTSRSSNTNKEGWDDDWDD